MKTSQAWSMDVMIAVIIFIGAIFTFYLIFIHNPSAKIEDLESDASIIMGNLNLTENASQIEEIFGEDYSELKEKLRVKNEFCIFLEDEDGNIVYVRGKPGVGSPEITISDQPCD